MSYRERRMTDRTTIRLPWPHKDLHSNSRAHFMAKARATKRARRDAATVAKAHGVPCLPDAVILIEYYPPTRRGDPHNVAASLKAHLDGIADAMGCDDRRFRVDYPTEFAGTRKPPEVVFHILHLVEVRGVVS